MTGFVQLIRPVVVPGPANIHHIVFSALHRSIVMVRFLPNNYENEWGSVAWWMTGAKRKKCQGPPPPSR
jgi:hypothetical protein